MNVAQWLNAIDLGQYEALFREHEIDANVLPDLVEADLEKIGVPLGHRKRLMRAIAALSGGGTPPSAAKSTSAQPSRSPPASGAEAERRPITVMFCDLVGSTEPRGAAGRRGLAQPGRRLSRRGLRRGDGSRRPCPEEARRRADGPVRLSAGAGERRRARRARGARDPARARRPQRQERPIRRARALRPHWHRVRLCRGRRGWRSVRRGAERRGAGAGGGRTGDGARHRERAAANSRAVRRRGQGRA